MKKIYCKNCKWWSKYPLSDTCSFLIEKKTFDNTIGLYVVESSKTPDECKGKVDQHKILNNNNSCKYFESKNTIKNILETIKDIIFD